MASAAGFSPATSTFAKWRADRLRYADMKLASVVGLAPTRLRWKDGPRELLCIHGRRKWSPRLVSRQRLFGFSEALICLSYSGYLKMVLPRGNAPRSVGYRPTALLLSYRRSRERRSAGNASRLFSPGTPCDALRVRDSQCSSPRDAIPAR